MLTQDQLIKLNEAICQDKVTDNPLVKLIKAAEQANVSFQDVLEHLIMQALENAYRTESLDLKNPSAAAH
jgi:hypothetical protein